MRSRGCGIYLLIYLLVDEGIAKLRYLKSYSTDDQSRQFVLKCPKVSCTRYCIIFYGELYYYLHFERSSNFLYYCENYDGRDTLA